MSMNQEDIIKYKSLYLQTSWGYLNMLRKNSAFLLKKTRKGNAVDAAHLAAHSLKSQSILMGYDQIGKISERMEKIFSIQKDNSTDLEDSTLKIIMSSLHRIQLSLTRISEKGTEIDMTDEIQMLDQVLSKD